MTTQQLDQTRQAWDSIAPGYDEFVTETEVRLANEGLGHVGLRPGERFLDVAAGAGGLCLPAARLGARVMATDIAPTMIERLMARAHAEGLRDVEARVMDGHDLDLQDDTFDVSASQFGVMLFPDLPRALKEMTRVTKRGGRSMLVVYGDPSLIEFLDVFMSALQAVLPGFTGIPEEPPPLEFQMSDPTKLRDALSAAGLRDVRIEMATENLEFRSGRQMWDWVTNSNPIGQMLTAELTQEQRTEVQLVLSGVLRERSEGNGPAVLRSPVSIGIGTK
jgi:ubiquinone/menaquinone biosynthesis C-methylase UbiE